MTTDTGGNWVDCVACDGTGQVAIQFEDTYFPMATDCRHCSGTGLGAWVDGAEEMDGALLLAALVADDDGDTRRHDAPYDFTNGRVAA